MARPDILLLEDTLAEMPVRALLEERFTIHFLAAGQDRVAAVQPFAQRIRGLSTSTLVGADAGLIAALPALEIIACAGTHVDRIDMAAAAARNICVTNTPHLSTDDVADLVVGLIIAASRKMGAGERFVRGGQWSSAPMALGRRVTGQRLGIVGLGRIGRALAERAGGFRMPVAYTGRRPHADAPFPYYPSAEALAREVDVLAVTARSAPETRRLIGRSVLEALGPAGVLVNVARGVVDDAALADALSTGTIAAAGLDVYENEPDVPAALRSLETVVLTPHIGSATSETRRAMADGTVANLVAYFTGRPLPSPVAAP
jgi:hydroxypyruvate reductase